MICKNITKGLTEEKANALYDKLTALPGPCLANFLVSDNSGNCYVPDNFLMKLTDDNCSLIPGIYYDEVAINENRNGEHIYIGNILGQSGSMNDGTKIRQMNIYYNHNFFEVEDKFGGPQKQNEATYAYISSGVLDIEQSGKLSELNKKEQ